MQTYFLLKKAGMYRYHSAFKGETKPVAGPSGSTIWGVGLDCLHAETVGSNPTSDMEVCSRLFIIIHFSACHRCYTV
jgi:hypothetical protein